MDASVGTNQAKQDQANQKVFANQSEPLAPKDQPESKQLTKMNPEIKNSSGPKLIGPFATFFRRSLFIVLSLGVFVTGAESAIDILAANGVAGIEIAIYCLFLVSFALISITFAQSLIGFF